MVGFVKRWLGGRRERWETWLLTALVPRLCVAASPSRLQGSWAPSPPFFLLPSQAQDGNAFLQSQIPVSLDTPGILDQTSLKESPALKVCVCFFV